MCLGALLGVVSAMLVTRRLEIEAPILVLLTVLRAGVPIMRLNGESQLKRQGRQQLHIAEKEMRNDV